jgi:sugar O-acyltransferase (sialic acid O-acetyltransferase NeuD family)
MGKLLLLGAKGNAKMAIEALEFAGHNFSEIALLDNYADHDSVFSYPVIGKCDDLERYRDEYTHAFVCIGGNNQTRIQFIKMIADCGYRMPNIIHPRAYVAKSAVLGTGVFINANAVIQSDSRIGNGCYIKSGAVVEHDNVLGDCVHIAANAATAGFVGIGNGVLIGVGASMIEHIQIGENTLVAAGSVVISDLPDNVMAAGCPAKIKKSLV